jgi:phospholipase/lecithinase/hemolysin
VVANLQASLAIYNNQLRLTAQKFQTCHEDVETAIVFDTQPLFNALLDNWEIFGFVNSTGWCEAYQNGTPSPTTQIPPCAPVSNYL